MRYLCMVFAAIGFVGCEGYGAKSTDKTPPVAKEPESHAHAAHGPHGGHPFSLAGLDYKIEAVTNKTNDLTQVFFLDHDAKAIKPIKAEKVVIKTDKLGGKSFELKPVNPDASGATAEYRLEDKELKSIVGLSPTLDVTVDGKAYSGTMDFHLD
jgi:hypothetical protein